MQLLSLLCVMVAFWKSCLTNRSCPDLIIDSCHCPAERSKQLSRLPVRIKVVCDDVELMDTLQPSILPNQTVALILSNNKISLLRNGSFYGLAALEKLDLRNNLISTVEPGAFRGLVALKKLDLSNNRIGCLSAEMFLDLGALSKLNLSGNIFSTLTVGLFSHLAALKVLHLASETLYCDCQLEWLLLWARANAVRLGNDTVCRYPAHLHSLQLRHLREQQLRCVLCCLTDCIVSSSVEEQLLSAAHPLLLQPQQGVAGSRLRAAVEERSSEWCRPPSVESGITHSCLRQIRQYRDIMEIGSCFHGNGVMAAAGTAAQEVDSFSAWARVYWTVSVAEHGALELPLFQLIPSQRQLVFRGDRLPLQCTASYLEPSAQLHWSHNGRAVATHEERAIYLEDTLLHDCCLLTSEIFLSNIDVDVAGVWECQVISSRGNRSLQMEIVVVETSATYCAADRMSNNKGDFRWPKTLAGILAFLPCAPPSFGSAPYPAGHAPARHNPHRQQRPPPQRAAPRPEKKAWRRCDRAGRWAEEDYTQCPYASELTRALHEITQMTINASNARPLGQQLVALTSRAALFTDVMDVIFVTHLVERLTRLAEKHRDLGGYVWDIGSNMMLVEEHLLWMAQNEARACTRIVQCVERIADMALTTDHQVVSKVSANIALEAISVRPASSPGLSCVVIQQAVSPSSSSSSAPHAPRPNGNRRRQHSQQDVGDRDPDPEEAAGSLLSIQCHVLNGSSLPPPANQLGKVRGEGRGLFRETPEDLPVSSFGVRFILRVLINPLKKLKKA
ncbi:unnamed protein product [Boreogadus saida]